MNVKMLTHVHLLVHTWWCWHNLRRRWSLKGREEFGILSPSRRACEAGFGAFEKMKCIFSIAPMESLEKSSECFSLKNTHQTLWPQAPDAKPVTGVLSVSGIVRVEHQTLSAGRGLDVLASGVAWLQQWDWLRAPDARSESSATSPVILRVWQPLYVRDRCAPDASSTYLTVSGGSNWSVRDQRARFD